MHADLDALLTAVYVLVDDLLPRGRQGRGRRPRISESELICLAVAQVLLDCPNERRFLRLAKRRLGHLFPYIPGQSGFNTRLRQLAPQLLEAITLLARLSPSFCDRLRLLDSTPVPCAASRETVRRSALAGHGGYGYCRSHSRWFWGFRLYLLCTPDGLPVGFELAAANAPERVVAAELLERVLEPGQTVICDKGFAGAEFEQLVTSLGGTLIRPDRRDEPPRFGSLGRIRQWIESTFDTLKDQLSLERHGGRTLTGLVSRIARRLLALSAALLHNWLTDNPGRSLTAYDH
ncbi:MAG TPA: IS982 family transposase [Thermoanaerobaculia bacterium]|nr:IS982 family transposase [Thermoanaerobaculia bacterium]